MTDTPDLDRRLDNEAGDLVFALTCKGGLLDQVAALTADRDVQDRARTAVPKPSSRAPWNGRAAGLAMDVHTGARRLEVGVHARLGTVRGMRGGSDQGTRDALDALPDLLPGLPDGDDWRLWTVASLRSWVDRARTLPAIDTAPAPDAGLPRADRDDWLTVKQITRLDPPPSLRTVRYWIAAGMLGDPLLAPVRGRPSLYRRATVLRTHTAWSTRTDNAGEVA